MLQLAVGDCAFANGATVERAELTADGVPVLTLSNRQSITYDAGLQAWVRFGDAWVRPTSLPNR